MSNDPKEPLLLDHDYDGIQELDNNLPRWWVWLFNITIIFAAVYLIVFHVLKVAPLQADEYKMEMKAGDALKSAAMGHFEANIPTLTPSTDPGVLDNGRQTYAKFCAPCHRADGGGRLLDSWQQLRGHRESHLGRRACQGHDHVEDGLELGSNPVRGKLHLHAARRETGHAGQAARESATNKTGRAEPV